VFFLSLFPTVLLDTCFIGIEERSGSAGSLFGATSHFKLICTLKLLGFSLSEKLSRVSFPGLIFFLSALPRNPFFEYFVE
jgi:hypothetical protein